MPTDSVSKAAESLIANSPLLGSIIVILCAVIVFLYWRNSEASKSLLAEKDARLADMQKANEITESIKSLIVPILHSIESMKTVLEVIKDRTKP